MIIGTRGFIFIAAMLATGLCTLCCRVDKSGTPGELAGQELAGNHCISCHLLPDPSDLDQSTWKYTVLPGMAERLGLDLGRAGQIESLKELSLFPEHPVVSYAEWNLISNYYAQNAPVFMPETAYKTVTDSSIFLNARSVLRDHPPFVSLLHIDKDDGNIYVGNARTQMLHRIDHLGNPIDSVKVPGAPSFIKKLGGNIGLLTMGELMPHDRAESSFSFLDFTRSQFGEVRTVVDSLRRAVHFDVAKRTDGNTDVLISCFGNNLGGLVQYSIGSSGKLTKDVLNLYPGTIKSVFADLDNDGHTDIVTLAAQGDERLLWYQNLGNGRYSENVIKRFPSTFGSTSFELVDFDNDGLTDILYTNGDNGDYRPIYKQYHGIRLYLQKSPGSFESAFFLPMNGVFKALARDFDMDGALDIAAISYFPNYTVYPEEGFALFINRGDHNFERLSHYIGDKGKWLVMASDDVDGDGDCDIVLGSAMFLSQDVPSILLDTWRKDPVSVSILINSTIK